MFDVEVYKELGAYERHINQMQSTCRTIASTWLLATFGGIGYIFSQKVEFFTSQNTLMSSCLALAGANGILLIWILDVMVYHRLLIAILEASKIIETENNYPRLRDFMGKQGDTHLFGLRFSNRRKISLFYAIPAGFLSLFSIISLTYANIAILYVQFAIFYWALLTFFSSVFIVLFVNRSDIDNSNPIFWQRPSPEETKIAKITRQIRKAFCPIEENESDL